MRSLIWLTRFSLFAAVFAGLALFSSLAAGRPFAPAHQTSSAPPAEVRELDLGGMKKLLARRGDGSRPLLVNFWATWCEPCRAEFPDLVEIDRDYRRRGLDLVLISLDEASEIKGSVPQFLREMKAHELISYLLNEADPEAAITSIDPAWSGALPATFLLDREGRLVFKHTGRIKPAELRAAIEPLVSAKPEAGR